VIVSAYELGSHRAILPGVDDYVRCRPSYPPEVTPFLERQCGLTPQSRVEDIGSGTGLLSGLFLRFGRPE
jgi:hypothetical protein